MATEDPTPTIPPVNAEKVARLRRELEAIGARAFVECRLDYLTLGSLLEDVMGGEA